MDPISPVPGPDPVWLRTEYDEELQFFKVIKISNEEYPYSTVLRILYRKHQGPSSNKTKLTVCGMFPVGLSFDYFFPDVISTEVIQNTHSLAHSLTHSLNDLSTHLLAHPLTQLATPKLTHPLTHPLHLELIFC